MDPVHVEISGDWQFKLEGERFEVPPPEKIRVADERYEELPEYRVSGGWDDGKALRGLDAVGCSLADALDPASVRVRLADGTVLERGRDYQFSDKWATIGRVAGGRIGENTPVSISYDYIPMRLDALFADAAGKPVYRKGEAAAWCPLPPAPGPGEKRLLNLFLDASSTRLTREMLYPVELETLPFESAAAMRQFLPQTMAKLAKGEKLRILAWGDSVTEGSYLDNKRERWQEQFTARLRRLYPAADIELITQGWGGRTISAFLAEPPGSPYNYRETVLDAKADLVITEFVNDAGLPPEVWEENFSRVLADFRRQGSEWLILTPHYIRPDWMGLTTQNRPAIEDDPRPYVHFLRRFTAENRVALADAAKFYGRLRQLGIPYNTLMTNNINHPDGRGMALFADALTAIFLDPASETPAVSGWWRFTMRGREFIVPWPAAFEVKDERFESLPLFNEEEYGGWLKGAPLAPLIAWECTMKDGLDPASLTVRLEDGTPLEEGRDYRIDPDWATVGRLAGGRIGENTPVLVDYRYTPERIDSVVEAGGRLLYREGTPATSLARPPALEPGERRLVNVFTGPLDAYLKPDNIFPITMTEFPAEPATEMQARLPQTMKKLADGGRLRILAWGDSVTECGYIPDQDRWQVQFVERLRERYPDADIELVSNGWGGRGSRHFLAEPAGSPHNYQETVLGAGADLIVSEFVNDTGVEAGEALRDYRKLRDDFRARGIEWIILTPHYVRPDWIGLETQNGPELEEDRRGYVKFLREFTAANGIALADAARRYGQLWKMGIPYNTLMVNTINHPDREGMKIFADALMAIFE